MFYFLGISQFYCIMWTRLYLFGKIWVRWRGKTIALPILLHNSCCDLSIFLCFLTTFPVILHNKIRFSAYSIHPDCSPLLFHCNIFTSGFLFLWLLIFGLATNFIRPLFVLLFIYSHLHFSCTNKQIHTVFLFSYIGFDFIFTLQLFVFFPLYDSFSFLSFSQYCFVPTFCSEYYVAVHISTYNLSLLYPGILRFKDLLA